MTKTLHFVIEGEFITKLAREAFWLEQKYLYAEKLLLSCMCGTDLREKQLKQNVKDILLGKRYLCGNSETGITLENDSFDPKKAYAKEYIRKIEKLENIVNSAFRVNKPDIEGTEHSYPYGWLSPSGTFYPVEWLHHDDFAELTVAKKGWGEDFWEWHKDMSAEDGIFRHLIHRDYLIMKRGWVLLHNPQQCQPFATCEEYKLTKAQREFLFDYFYKLKDYEAANKYIEK